jgi:hypothetical protein
MSAKPSELESEYECSSAICKQCEILESQNSIPLIKHYVLRKIAITNLFTLSPQKFGLVI